jgi:predicted Zn-dependent peptidase
MNIDEYFELVQNYVSDNIENPNELNLIISQLKKDNLQAVVNQCFNNDESVSDCGDKILDYTEIDTDMIVDPNKIDGDRALNTMERKILSYKDFILEKNK